jgi:hypothetical protein
MSTPSTTLYVHPGWASVKSWSYAGTSFGSSTVTAVAFDVNSSLGQSLSRGAMQYSTDHGQTWINYTAPSGGQGSFVPVANTVWRFQDLSGSDDTSANTFSAHYQLADGSVVEVDTTVMVDDQPVGVVNGKDTMFSTMHAGDVVDTLAPIDSGDPNNGRWVIDSQSQPGLFSISYNPATDSTARLVIADPGQLPASGVAASVTVHYYDPYQIDTNGNPIAGQGKSDTFSYTVQDGATNDLAGFTAESRMGAATDAWHAGPALATLSTGGYVAVWQGPDTVAGGAGAGLWAQLRDAGGNALGTAFALTPIGDAKLEGQPAVAALSGGRFVVAYAEQEGGVQKIAYRVVDAKGAAGAEHMIDNGGAGDAAMPAVAALADGSFVVGWRSGGAVHVQQAAGLDGTMIGGQKVFTTLSSAYSPSLAALADGGYVVSWGEMNDGNVYASVAGSPTSNKPAFMVSTDGNAASISTAAPLSHVTALAGGGYVVAWDSYANDPLGFSESDIFFQVYDSSGHATGTITQANVDSGGGRYDAEVAALSGGGFVVTWEGSDFDGNGIFGRRFGTDGSALDGHEFEINQLRAGDQSNADVTALAGGGFASAWVDTAVGGSVGIETRVLPPVGGADSGASGNSGAGSDTGAAPTTPDVPATPTTPTTPTTPDVPTTSTTPTTPDVPTTPTTPTTPDVPTTPTTPVTPTTPSVPSVPSPLVSVAGGGGSDVMTAPGGNAKVDGGDGLDTLVFGGGSSAYTVQHNSTGFTVLDTSGHTTTLANVERLQFGDGMVALDINGTAGQAYRLYQAAFDRTPDKGGLGFWIAGMDKGETLLDAAKGFVGSKEFTDLYGVNTSDAQFVDALYQNVLHRTPDQSGYDFWTHAIQIASRAEVLANFSESAENQTQVIGSIQNGIAYLHWG